MDYRMHFNVGKVTIYYYSIMILLGVITALLLAYKESKKYNLKEYIEDLSFYAIIFGIIGARIYYVVFSFSEFKNNILDVFKIWEGGIAIYGAIIAGFLTVLYFSKKYKVSLLTTTDIIVPGLIIAQSIGRWGNFFNHEAYGSSVSLEFLKRLHLPSFIIDNMYIKDIESGILGYWHPTFLYESMWCLLGFLIILIVRKISKRKKGYATFTYFIWYGIGRFFIEGLRIDSLYLFNFRVSQLVSIVLIVVGIVGYIMCSKGGKNERKI